jgi:hypothetical protein
VLALAHPYVLALHPSFSPFLLPYVWTKKKRGGEKKGENEREKWEIARNTRVLKVVPFPSS